MAVTVAGNGNRAEGSSVGGIVVGVDIGGTFTDIMVWSRERGLAARKVLSTPRDYSLAIIEGLKAIAAEGHFGLQGIREIAHGTTLGTNAVLERKGARTALVTTRGFRDVMTFRHGRQGDPFDFNWDRPEPLVPRRLRAGVGGRVSSLGEEVRPVDAQEIGELAATLQDWQVESVAVALINAYANGAHEQQVRALLQEKLPGLYVSLSSDLLPLIGEYERTSTTIANAYIAPILDRYLSRLRDSLDSEGIKGPLFVCQSSGGLFLHEFARQKPVLTLESGPAAGCVAARHYARELGCANAVAVDMGGTTTKATFIHHGELDWATQFAIGSPMSTGSRLDTGQGYIIQTPSIDVAEVGAGGGSIAWMDDGGVLHIGPESAGADPGPACYGQGGTRPTLTDANVVLGYVNPVALAGGRFPIDRAKAEQSLAGLAAHLGKSIEETAFGIHQIANANMVTAIRRVTTETGRDLRHADMIAYGGSGPVQAVGLARSLEMRRVIVPRYPGLFSGYGLLTASIEHHLMKTVIQPLHAVDIAALNRTLAELEEAVTGELRAYGYGGERIELSRLADLKFDDRAGETTMPLPARPLAAGGDMDELEREFLRVYQEVHNYTPRGSGILMQSVRVVARIARPIAGLSVALREDEWRPPEAHRAVYFGPTLGRVQTPVLARSDLRAGSVIGPAIIEEADSSTVIQPGCSATLGLHDCIIVNLEAEGR